MDATQPAIAMVVPGSIATQKGGAAMRWRALREALNGCEVVELGCNHRQQCLQVCAATGGVPPNRGNGNWHYTNSYCDNHAEHLARRFVAGGVSTVVCSGLETHRYVEAFSKADLRVVYDMHNVEAPLFRSIDADSGLPNPELPLIERAEELAVRCADEIWTCSADDARLLHATYPFVEPTAVQVVPNAVSVSAPPMTPSPRPVRVVFTGQLRWHPNVVAVRTLAEEIVPALRRRAAGLPVVVAGAQPDDVVIELCRAAGIELFAGPRSTTDLIAGGIMVVPLTLGGGTRLKALEAFAQGTPLVSTAKGVEGLDVAPGVHYLPAETAADFAESITRLTTEDGLRDALITRAWDLVRDRYSVTALVDRLRAVTWRT